MNSTEFRRKLEVANYLLEELDYDEGVFFDSALHGFLMTALCCVSNALLHTNEFKRV